MISKILLSILFWSFAIYGAIERVRSMRKLRVPQSYTDSIFDWSEYPISSFKYDTLSWLATSIHWVTIVLLGLFQYIQFFMNPLSVHEVTFISLPFEVLMGGFMSLTGFWLGSTLFHPIAGFLGGNRHYAISVDGILWAGYIVPWSAISHFSFDHEKGMIRLWSSSLRGTVLFQFIPAEENVQRIIDILGTYLPDENKVSDPGFLQQCVFPILMAIACMSVAVVAYAVVQLVPDFFPVANIIFLYVLMLVGGPALIRSLFGRTLKPALASQK
jgi:hypothetical protein